MTTGFRADNIDQVAETVQWAVSADVPLTLRGGASKSTLGRHVEDHTILDLSGLSGVSLYEPEELVMTAGAGTRLTDIEAALSEHGQQLAFEPPRWNALLGSTAEPTIGGVFACNLSGPRRFKAGAARDHLLGVKGVTGRGEAIKTGGRVVKNVTGYDLCKLAAGSYGTLLAMTEVTFKVLPTAEKQRTVLLFGFDAGQAVAALGDAARSPHDVSGLAYLPAAAAARSAVGYVSQSGGSVAAIRVEGPGPSVEYRCAALRAAFTDAKGVEELHSANSRTLWREIAEVAPLMVAPVVWRLSVPPAEGAGIAARLSAFVVDQVLFDWSGGLIWCGTKEFTPGQDRDVRGVVDSVGGHATLIKADADVRAQAAVFHPQPAELAALARRVKDSFDPHHVLNRGRMVPRS